MISSPCLKCQKKNQPKEECASDCILLQEVQDFQVSLKDYDISTAIDYSEEGRFIVNSKEVS